MREYSMSEVARKLGIQRATLYAWLRRRKIPAPKARTISGVRFCFWTSKGLGQIKKYKDEHYREKPTLRKQKAR
jgi:excisionase family DNA binding protein